MSVFNKADILIPKNVDFEKWSVVACDQYTSQPEYWEKVKAFVGDAPSSLKLVYPEAFLSEGDARIKSINAEMEKYLKEGIFSVLKDSLIYVERTLNNKKIRRGIVGAVDLEEYNYLKGSKSKIRATEGTVISRIPPRVKIRRNAPLELPHAILLINDEKDGVFSKVDKGDELYSFDLFAGGGHIAAWRIKESAANEVVSALDKYEENAKDSLAYAVGDGNHSLAAAKACWEEIKTTLSEGERKTHPARYCLVELENIQHSAQEFEPIHRVVYGVGLEKVMNDLKRFYSVEKDATEPNAQRLDIISGGEKTKVYITNPKSNLTVGSLQCFIDEMGYEADYIHGEDALCEIAAKEGAVGFILPKPSKDELFETVIADGALPRKTFSMGEANEKRYYLEAKKIRS